MSIQALEVVDRFDVEEVGYYYDTHPTEEDLMGDSVAQDMVSKYLVEVMEWFYASQAWFIARNLNLYLTGYWMEYPRTPDVSVFKGVVLTLAQRQEMKSWRILPPEKPAPSVVFEVISDNFPERDLKQKPVDYAGTGIREYFCYDPRLFRDVNGERIHGWRYSGSDEEAIEPDARGRLWSQELESWLFQDGLMLRLTDGDGNLRLTKAEAEEREKEQARREAAQARREAAQARGDAAQARREAEREREENERLHALLRSLGRDIEGDGSDGRR